VTGPAAPRIRFVIGGVQKAGTTALASFLGTHPGVALPERKEAHVFDDPGFDEAWDAEAVDRRFAPHFPSGWGEGVLHGDATPIYLLHRRFVERIRTYNPAMRWIVLLRHPVERALSQYHMERGRGDEHLPLWLALLSEPWRLRGRLDDFAWDSPLRHHSYRLRGDYVAQLEVLHGAFPREQVLLLRNEELARDPATTLARVHRFLGLDPLPGTQEFPRVFEGSYPRWQRGGWRMRLLGRWWRRELESQARHGFDWGRR